MKPIDSLDDGPAVAGPSRVRSTTILTVCRNGKVVMAGDGQVTVGDTIMKHQARKVRKMYHDKILAGFSGATADAFTLFERLEGKLDQYSGNLTRAAVELAKDWRLDRALRRLEALLIAADREQCLVLSGSGDVIEPDDGLAAVGSGAPYALAAARALTAHTDLPLRTLVEESMKIAASICIYTNHVFTVEEL
ncbi:ATP-dependent protease subunit HslV [Desulfoglaeba alkanexedens]|jgi:ATP-dependent HslUV protease subunit HslV|uniref:ATP-dependent protease subunit HslV n=1 Tax=Desulfoglaeba alkanexedens ALDC TaxID=980445 RepID=A0A4V1ER97_9BACT|nr:ATP-dependent protease subunit HslV [Desulfoglaeba alkanexedens]QCQ20881.1 ATP-dependent protease subunit HslV [Desulfoglaeba alkanexedens ALDC]